MLYVYLFATFLRHFFSRRDKSHKKINEHNVIITEVTKDIEIMLKKLQELRKDSTNKTDIMTTSSTLLTLKDKVIFHRASLLTLQDVLSELE